MQQGDNRTAQVEDGFTNPMDISRLDDVFRRVSSLVSTVANQYWYHRALNNAHLRPKKIAEEDEE